MSLNAGVGYAFDDSSYEVGRKASSIALASLDGVKPQCAIVFSAIKYKSADVLKGIQATIGDDVPIVGSSTAGEIVRSGQLQHDSVVVTLITSDSISFYPAITEHIKDLGSVEAGQKLGKAILDAVTKDKQELKTLIIFPDVLDGNGARIVDGITSVIGDEPILVGGASGDNQEFKKTFQYMNNTVYSGAISGVGLAGDVQGSIGVRHGWTPIGLPMTVTKSEGSKIYEIDHKPAIKVYEDYFGRDKSELLRGKNVSSFKSVLTYPFGLVDKHHKGEISLRIALNVDKDGSITCAADVPEGSDIRLMIGSKEEAIAAARLAAQTAIEGLNGRKPKLCLVFNCIARKNLYGEDGNQEIEAIQDVIGFDVPLAGFYTYGEQASVNGVAQHYQKCDSTFHNETIVIYLLS